MPLSEHEQRLLEQIEKGLYAEDPKFASAVRAHDLRTHHRRRLRRSVLLFVVGICALLAGVILKLVPLSVGAFVLMLVAALQVSGAVRGLAGKAPAATVAAPKIAQPKAKGGGSLGERAEERWRRRWEDDGQ